MARRAGRLTRREEISRINAADRYYAIGAGKEPLFQRPLPPIRNRTRGRSASGKPLERDVLKAVVQVLRYDKRVARVERNQSGLFQEGDRTIRVGTPGKLDLTIYLKDGRYLECEVKRPGGKPNPKQASRIEAIRAAGGLAGYCWSAESALALLP